MGVSCHGNSDEGTQSLPGLDQFPADSHEVNHFANKLKATLPGWDVYGWSKCCSDGSLG